MASSITPIPMIVQYLNLCLNATCDNVLQGIYTPQYTPVGRGFAYSFGFLEGGEDHNTSRTFGDFCKKNEVDLSYGKAGGETGNEPYPYVWPTCTWTSMPGVALHNFFDSKSVDIQGYNAYPRQFDSEAGCRKLCENRIDCEGYSWRNADPSSANYHKCFLVSEIGLPGNENPAFTSARCTRSSVKMLAEPTSGVSTIAAVGQNGTYTGQVRCGPHACECRNFRRC